MPADYARPGQRASRVHHPFFNRPVQTVSLVVKYNCMHVDQAAERIPQDKVPRAGIVSIDIAITPRREQAAQRRHIGLLDDDVDVAVSPGLFAEQGVDTPSAVHPGVDKVVFQHPHDLDNIRSLHFDIILPKGTMRRWGGDLVWGNELYRS